MSTTIDQRVVEMQFDNKNFESNVRTSMSTLEKLKERLNLTGASKGLENVNAAAKKIDLTKVTDGLNGITKSANKVDLSGIGHAADTVGLRFNAMYTIADQALRNLTTRAQDTISKIASTATTSAAKSGFQEYETQIGAIQTIMANTSHEGTTLNQVNAALDTLNTYADKTIYNFTEMTRNIGTFTAAGVDLQTSVESIQGIANLAAVSGSTSQQASTAMYQLSQALAAGKVSLMDWNSVVNAGMGGKVFQDALLRTSELLKTGGEQAVKTYGSFRESLSRGEWLTTEVLTETLKQFAGAYSEADLIAQGFTESQAKEIASMANTAEEAATKVKTFTQLIDTVKESLQSGWAQSWRIIIGDFEEAKELWSGISKKIGAVIEKSSKKRNDWLHEQLDSGWEKMTNTLNEAGIETDVFEEKLTNLLKGKDYDVDKMIEKYGSLEKAFQKGKFKASDLKEALESLGKTTSDLSSIDEILKFGSTGDDVKKLQTALESAGHKLSKFGVDGIIGSETTEAIKEFQKLKGLKVDGIVGPETLKALEEASKSSKEFKGNIDDLVEEADELGGRALVLKSLATVAFSLVKPIMALKKALSESNELGAGKLVFESFVNIFETIAQVVNIVRGAFESVFEPISGKAIYNIIEKFHGFTENLGLTFEQAHNLKMTFKGLFQILETAGTFIKDTVVGAFTSLTKFVGELDIDIFALTSKVSTIADKFANWAKSTIDLKAVFDKISPYINTFADTVKAAYARVKQFFDEVINMPNVQSAFNNVIEIFTNFKQSIEDIFSIIKGDFEFEGDVEEVANNIASGLVNGLFDGAGAVWDAIKALASGIITQFCEVLGIESPSTVMEEKGENIGEGLLNGLISIADTIWEFVKKIGTEIAEIFSKIDWRTLFAAGMGIAMLYTAKKMVNVLENITSPLSGIGDMLDSFSNVSNAFAKKIRAQALKHIAEAIAILVGSLIALQYAVSKDWKSFAVAAGTLLGLSLILVGLMFAMNKLCDASVKLEKGKGISLDGLKSGLISIGIAMALLAASVRMMGTLEPEQAAQGFIGLGILVAAIAGVFWAFSGLMKNARTTKIDAVGGMLIKLSIAMGLLVLVCKLAGTLDENAAWKGAGFAAAFIVFVTILGEATKNLGDNIDKLGGMLIKVAIAMGLLVGVCKLAGMLNETDAQNGILFAACFLAFLFVLVQITKVDKGQEFAKLGGMLMSVSISLLLMIGVCKLVGLLQPDEIVKAVGFVGAFLVFIKVLITVTKIGSEEQIAKVGLTILALSAAVAIMAGVAIILGLIKLGDLAKGIFAVGLLSRMMIGMVKATKDAKDVKGTMIGIAIAIGVIAIAVAALSLIKPSKLAAATIALSVLMGAFGKMAKNAGSMGKVMGPILAMSAAVIVLGFVLKMIASLPIEQSIGSAVALSILLLAMSAAMKIIGGIGTISFVAIGALAVMTLIVGLLGLILGGLNKLNFTVSIETASALSILLLAMSGACIILGAVGPLAAQAMMGAVALAAVILILGGLVAAIGGLVTAFPQMQTFLDNGIPALEAIGKGIGKFIGGFIGGIGEGLSASFKQMMTDFADGISELGRIPTEAIDGALNLVKIMGIMAGVNIADSISTFLTGDTPMETFKTNALAFADAMIALSDKISGTTIDNAAIESLAASGTAFATLNQSLPRQDGWVQDIIGEQNLADFGLQVAAFAGAMLAINTAVSAEGFAFNSAAFEAMATAGTQFSTLNAALPRQEGWVQDIVGSQDLGAFGESCTAFVDAMISVNEKVSAEGFSFNEEAFTAIATAGTKFTEINEALPRQDGWIQDILGEQSLTDFGDSVAAFADAMLTINEKVSAEGFAFNEEAFTAMTTAGTKFTELNEALPAQEGWIQDIVGSKQLGPFGDSVAAFADTMIAINEKVSAEGFAFNEEAITAMVNSGTKLADLETVIPKSGGWWQKIAGSSDISDFGTRIKTFGEEMVNFTTAIADFDNSNVFKVLDVARRLKTFIVGLSGLDTSGVNAFAGDTANWGEEGAVIKIATAMANFGTRISEINIDAVDTAATAAKKLKTLIAGLVDLDTSGIENFKIDSIGEAMKTYGESVSGIDTGVVSASITAANRLKNFINSLASIDSTGIVNFRLGSIGTAMKSYSDNVATMNVEIVSRSISLAYRLKGFINGLSDLDNSGVSKFTISSIGDALKLYSDNVSSINITAIDASIATANKIKKFINSLANLDTSGVSTFTSSISTLGQANVSGLSKTFSSASTQMSNAGSDMISSLAKGMKNQSSTLTNSATSMVGSMTKAIGSSKGDFDSAGSTLMTNLISGITDKSLLVKTSVTTAVSTACTSIRLYYDSFKTNGKWLGDGLISGINAKKDAVYWAAYKLGKKAVQGEKDGQDSNSPSKATEQAGKWFGEGLVIGIDKMSKAVYNSSKGLGQTAVKTMSATVANIASAIDSDIDTQPTIRPVLDLSDVQTGASTIGNLFNSQHSVGLAANLSAITGAMSDRNQNGVNDDVVSAINKLSKQLSNVGNTNYNINGVTYDDGTNVSNAVESLIRYAKIEGRA